MGTQASFHDLGETRSFFESVRSGECLRFSGSRSFQTLFWFMLGNNRVTRSRNQSASQVVTVSDSCMHKKIVELLSPRCSDFRLMSTSTPTCKPIRPPCHDGLFDFYASLNQVSQHIHDSHGNLDEPSSQCPRSNSGLEG